MPRADTPFASAQLTADRLVLRGPWTAQAMGPDIQALRPRAPTGVTTQLHADATEISALDTAGAWVLQTLLQSLQQHGKPIELVGLRPEFQPLLSSVAPAVSKPHAAKDRVQRTGLGLDVKAALERLGHWTVDAGGQFLATLSFVGEAALAVLECAIHPGRLRWRAVLFNIRSAGFDALPIVGLMSFLLGVVVAYQSAEQLRRYGANVFIADIIGLSMVREFAPLMTAIIVAGRSGSAYAAQIGTMQVTEEIDAMRTLGISPQNMLVVPKLLALAVAMPLLTVFADITGVLGGMLMARAQLDVSFTEFLDRLAEAVSATSYLTGIGKAPVFAVIIVTVGCFQGFQTRGGAESVGLQTTRSVVHSIALVILADALFSLAFNVLDL